MKSFVTILLFLLAFSAFSQTIETIAHINKATIFSSRAQIESDVEAKLPQGNSKLTITDLASTIDPNSIQIGGRGDFVLLAVNFEKDFISKKMLVYQDSIETLNTEIEKLDMLLEVSAKENEMLMANTKIKSDNDDLYADDLEEMSKYFRKKLTELGSQKLQLAGQKKVLIDKRTRIQKQLETDPSRNLPLGRIILTVKANNPTTARLNLKYLVFGTGWRPNYDIRVANTESPVNLLYKAEVFQNTGVDWNNVKLSLSTASVNNKTVKPELNPQFLYFFENRPPMVKMMQSRMGVVEDKAKASMEMQAAANFTEVVENDLNVKFDISIPYSIKSGSSETVEVQNLNIDAKYVTYVVPKFDENGFLVAEISNWEKYNLIPAAANVYFEDTFIGKSFVAKAGVEDVLKVSLGRDERIQVKREEIKDFKARKTFGSNIRETFGYEITVRNTKNEIVNISVEDQLPVSQDSDIQVETEEISGGTVNNQTGKITWDLSIPAAQSHHILLKYMVKYPKDKSVANL